MIAGVVAASLTNAFEAITVAKQTTPSTNIIQLVKRERFNLMTKGLIARVYLNGA